MQSEEGRFDNTAALSLALGCFSIALGVAGLIAPRRVARLIGVQPDGPTCTILRAYGAREIATGLGIVSNPTEPGWLWSRVGGDALDLATLGRAADDDNANHGRLAVATMAVLGVTALDVMAARSLGASREEFDEFGFSLANEQAITIKLPMESVEPAWETWCISGHAKIRNQYAVRFEPAPGARGTEVHLSGGGSKGTIREELRRFKAWVETGEVQVSDGPGLWRAAQPPRDAREIKSDAEVWR